MAVESASILFLLKNLFFGLPPSEKTLIHPCNLEYLQSVLCNTEGHFPLRAKILTNRGNSRKIAFLKILPLETESPETFTE